MTTEERIAWRAYVSGRVQGVNFRAATARQAQRLGVAGHARNLADGRVEVLAVGPPAAVRALCEWLHRGPPLAEVRAVEESGVAVEEAAGLAGFRSL